MAESSLPHDAAAGRLVPASAAVPAIRTPYSPLGGYGPAPAGDSGDLAATLFEYLRIIDRRKWLILSILVTFVTIGAVRTLMQTPLYTASVRLQIDRNVAKIVEGGNIGSSADGGDFDFLRTQYELLQSRTLAERVVSSLKLADDADFRKPRDFSIVGAIGGLLWRRIDEPSADKRALDTQATGIVLGGRAVRPVPGSRLVDITYTDPVPTRAQRIANAYADAYISSNIDKRFEANSYAKTFLEDQSQQLKLRLEASEKALLEFAEKEQIIVVNEKSSIAENNLAAANASLGGLITERIKNEQIWRQVESVTGIDLPQFLNNGVIVGLRAQRNVLASEYQDKLQTFKQAYPTMVELSNRIREIDRQLAVEVKTIKAALKGAYDASRSQEAETRKQIDELRQEVLDLQRRSIQYNTLKREVDTNRSLYNGLLQRFKEVDIAGGVGANNVFIVDRAVPGWPSSPNLTRALLLSLALGLGAGLAAAYVLERLDDTIGSPEEIERATGLTMLGIIPKISSSSTAEAEVADPRSAISEAYRSLCTSLQFTTDSGLPKSMLITSSGPGEGKSITALAIARHFAALGLKVLLIDADLRNPSMHKKLDLDNGTGLSNYLTGACTPPEAMQTTTIPNLAFMATGPLPPNAADLLGSPRLLSLLTIGLEVFDLIVLDGPPVMGLADAQLLSSSAASTIFVVGGGQVRSGAVRGALKRLELARAPIIGAVLTKYDARTAGYGYGSGYGYSYGADAYTYGAKSVAGTGDNGKPRLSDAKGKV